LSLSAYTYIFLLEMTQKIIAALKEKKLKEEKQKNIPKISPESTIPTEVTQKHVVKGKVTVSENIITPIEKTQSNKMKPKIAEKPKLLIEDTKATEKMSSEKPMTDKPKIAAKPQLPGNKPKLTEKPMLPPNKPKLSAEKFKSSRPKLLLAKTKAHGVKSPEKVKSPPIQIKPILKKSVPKQEEKVTEVLKNLPHKVKPRLLERSSCIEIENTEWDEKPPVKVQSGKPERLQDSRVLTEQPPKAEDVAGGLIEELVKPKELMDKYTAQLIHSSIAWALNQLPRTII